jgi:hypothetical protein
MMKHSFLASTNMSAYAQSKGDQGLLDTLVGERSIPEDR